MLQPGRNKVLGGIKQGWGLDLAWGPCVYHLCPTSTWHVLSTMASIPLLSFFCFCFFFERFYLFTLESQEEREKEEREFETLMCERRMGCLSHTPNQGPSPRWPLGSQASAESTEPHRPGLPAFLSKSYLFSDSTRHKTAKTPALRTYFLVRRA